MQIQSVSPEKMANTLLSLVLVLPRLGQLLLGCAFLLSKQGEFFLFDAGKLKDLLQQASQVSTPHLFSLLLPTNKQSGAPLLQFKDALPAGEQLIMLGSRRRVLKSAYSNYTSHKFDVGIYRFFRKDNAAYGA
jgi:hypothetical protein